MAGWEWVIFGMGGDQCCSFKNSKTTKTKYRRSSQNHFKILKARGSGCGSDLEQVGPQKRDLAEEGNADGSLQYEEERFDGCCSPRHKPSAKSTTLVLAFPQWQDGHETVHERAEVHPRRKKETQQHQRHYPVKRMNYWSFCLNFSAHEHTLEIEVLFAPYLVILFAFPEVSAFMAIKSTTLDNLARLLPVIRRQLQQVFLLLLSRSGKSDLTCKQHKI